jgi:hypothetical protein
LKDAIDGRTPLTIIDVRHPLDLLSNPFTIPSAVRIPTAQRMGPGSVSRHLKIAGRITTCTILSLRPTCKPATWKLQHIRPYQVSCSFNGFSHPLGHPILPFINLRSLPQCWHLNCNFFTFILSLRTTYRS